CGVACAAAMSPASPVTIACSSGNRSPTPRAPSFGSRWARSTSAPCWRCRPSGALTSTARSSGSSPRLPLHCDELVVTTELRRHSRESIAEIARNCLASSHIDRSAYFYDVDRLDERLEHLAAAFPPTTLHAVAIKTQPSLEVLRAI